MKKLVLLLFVLSMIVSISYGEEPFNSDSYQPNSTRLEGEGFDTPEEAVLAYIDAMNRGDVGSMLSTFAMESFVAHLDTSLYMERTGVYSPTSYAIPIVNEYMRSLVLYNRYGGIANKLLYAFLESSSEYGLQNVRFKTLEEKRELEDAFQQSPLKDMTGNIEFVQWINPFILSDGNDAYLRLGSTAITENAAFGMDDYTEIAAWIRIDGKDAIQIMACVKYGDRWYNLDYNARVAVMAQNIKSTYEQTLWLLSEEESRELAWLLESEHSKLYYSWDALQTSELGGTRWPLVSVSATDVTLCDNSDDAEECVDGLCLWAELHFFRVGGAMITFTANAALQEKLGMENATARITFTWTLEGIPTSYTNRNRKEIGLFRFIDMEDIAIDLNDLTVNMTEDIVTFTLNDGTQAVFHR